MGSQGESSHSWNMPWWKGSTSLERVMQVSWNMILMNSKYLTWKLVKWCIPLCMLDQKLTKKMMPEKEFEQLAMAKNHYSNVVGMLGFLIGCPTHVYLHWTMVRRSSFHKSCSIEHKGFIQSATKTFVRCNMQTWAGDPNTRKTTLVIDSLLYCGHSGHQRCSELVFDLCHK